MGSTVVVAVHDGYFGCGTGAGAANRAFLSVLAEVLPPQVRLVVLPVRLDPAGPEYHAEWHAATRTMLSRAEVRPVGNGTCGADRFGTLPDFRHLAGETAGVLRELVAQQGNSAQQEDSAQPGDSARHSDSARQVDSVLCIAFDVPFLGLAETVPPEVELVLVPRSTGLLHQPQDTERVRWERRCLRAAAHRGARIGWISRFMAEHLRRDHGVPASALVPLPDGLLDSELPPVADVPVAAQGGFVLAFGRAEPYKGFGDFVEALRMLDPGALPHVVLAAVSESPGRTAYQRELAAALRGLPASFLADFDPAVRGMLGHPALRAVVVPSRSEPFGRIPLEAYAAGAAPVVATRTGGLTEQVADGVTGFLAEPGDPADLARALRRALRCTPEQRARIRRRSQDVLARHDYRESISRFLRANGYRVPMLARSAG